MYEYFRLEPWSSKKVGRMFVAILRSERCRRPDIRCEVFDQKNGLKIKCTECNEIMAYGRWSRMLTITTMRTTLRIKLLMEMLKPRIDQRQRRRQSQKELRRKWQRKNRKRRRSQEENSDPQVASSQLLLSSRAPAQSRWIFPCIMKFPSCLLRLFCIVFDNR